MAKIHELKTAPEFWWPLMRGEKTSEVRLNDRDFAVGDVLVLREWTEEAGITGGMIWRQITHILRSEEGPWLADGYVILSLGTHAPAVAP